MNIAHWLQRTACLKPERPAVFAGTQKQLTYRELGKRVRARAAALSGQYGIRTGDRVGIFLENHPHYLEILYAVWQLGAAAVPINYKLHPKEAAFILEDSGAELVFVRTESVLADAGVTARVIEVDGAQFAGMIGDGEITDPVPRNRDDLAWLFYTSGTTGKPKGVMISHGNIHAMAFAYLADVDEVREDDSALYAAPLSHGAGIYNFMHVMRGAAHCIPASGGFEPAEILALGKAFGSIHMFAAPTMVRRLVDAAKAAGETGQGIRTIVYGGGPMYLADIVDAVDVMGPRFVQIYGQGECPMAITSLPRDLVCDRSHPRWKERLGSVGTAQSCVEVRIADDAGQDLPTGQSGEIIVRGAPVMPGYWKNPEANARALKDEWLYTGDVGRLDEDGFLTLTDRSKDVIISGGTNIYPREVEEVLLQLEDVAEVSVVGAPDAQWGEVIVAFAVLREGASLSAADLDRHCLDNMARFKRPKRYEFLPELPKNTYGKVLKTDLRSRLSQEQGLT